MSTSNPTTTRETTLEFDPVPKAIACAQAPACRAAQPDLPATLAAICNRLSREGRDFALTDPRTGEPQTHRITFDQVIGALQPRPYSPELSALLPEIIGRAAAGDFGPLYAGAMLVTGDVAEQMNNALHYSVTCAEDAPRVSPAEATSALADVRAEAPEPLLTTPVAPLELSTGKWLAVVVLNATAVVLTLSGSYPMLRFAPLPAVGIPFLFDLVELGRFVGALIPLIVLMPALLLYVGSRADRSRKRSPTCRCCCSSCR